ncbi:hypothetical protein BgiBS90_031780 [Biomphalaria glabrata]|nr:hypothetical protein BgiBS90_031780 [Biomphalaria glabrata]
MHTSKDGFADLVFRKRNRFASTVNVDAENYSEAQAVDATTAPFSDSQTKELPVSALPTQSGSPKSSPAFLVDRLSERIQQNNASASFHKNRSKSFSSNVDDEYDQQDSSALIAQTFGAREHAQFSRITASSLKGGDPRSTPQPTLQPPALCYGQSRYLQDIAISQLLLVKSKLMKQGDLSTDAHHEVNNISSDLDATSKKNESDSGAGEKGKVRFSDSVDVHVYRSEAYFKRFQYRFCCKQPEMDEYAHFVVPHSQVCEADDPLTTQTMLLEKMAENSQKESSSKM